MKSFKSLFASCLLVAILAVAGFAQSSPTLSAVTVVSQLPTTCALNAQVVLQASGGAYSGQTSGLYTCVQANLWQKFGQGANTIEVLGGDFTNATATAATFLSFPLNPNGNYQFECTLYWQNSGTSGDFVLTLLTPTSPTNTLAFAQIYTTNTGTNNAGVLSSSPLAYTSTAAAGAGATTYKALIDGTIENGANAGTLAFQASSSAGTTTIKRGSFCRSY